MVVSDILITSVNVVLTLGIVEFIRLGVRNVLTYKSAAQRCVLEFLATFEFCAIVNEIGLRKSWKRGIPSDLTSGVLLGLTYLCLITYSSSRTIWSLGLHCLLDCSFHLVGSSMDSSHCTGLHSHCRRNFGGWWSRYSCSHYYSWNAWWNDLLPLVLGSSLASMEFWNSSPGQTCTTYLYYWYSRKFKTIWSNFWNWNESNSQFWIIILISRWTQFWLHSLKVLVSSFYKPLKELLLVKTGNPIWLQSPSLSFLLAWSWLVCYLTNIKKKNFRVLQVTIYFILCKNSITLYWRLLQPSSGHRYSVRMRWSFKIWSCFGLLGGTNCRSPFGIFDLG